jgi:hypothetical protein
MKDRIKLRCIDIEIALSKHFNPRQNLIVPNVSWGMFNHECDVVVLTKAGYATEIEIKVTKRDLIKDGQKWHGHNDEKLKFLYFAIPDYLESCVDYIPERAGIFFVSQSLRCREVRKPVQRKNPYKFSDHERYKLARLGALRIWTLKNRIAKT